MMRLFVSSLDINWPDEDQFLVNFFVKMTINLI